MGRHDFLKPGDRFGHWTVLEYIGLRKASANARNRLRMYRCRCDCGRIRDVRGSDLTRGVSQACGCRRWEARERNEEERFKAQMAAKEASKNSVFDTVTRCAPKPYVPEHPELFTDDWMFGDKRSPLI